MNISERMAPLDFQPVSALFAAASSLEWLVQGAESVDWWDLNNFGSPSTGDFGLATSGGQEAQPGGSALPPYYGEELASRLTATGSRLQSIATGKSALLCFESTLGNKRRVLLVNTSPRCHVVHHTELVREPIRLQIETYSAATASASDPVTKTNRAGGAVGPPARLLRRCPLRTLPVLTAAGRTGQRRCNRLKPCPRPDRECSKDHVAR